MIFSVFNESGNLLRKGTAPNLDLVLAQVSINEVICLSGNHEFAYVETEDIRIEKIKRIAEMAILNIAPEWKQRNMLARSVELADKKGSGPLTPDEIAEENAMRAVWAQIKEIRRKSDLAEAQGTQPNDIAW